MDKILKKIVQNSKIIESRDLGPENPGQPGRLPQPPVFGRQGPRDERRPVLDPHRCEMPSVLVEVSHISNPMEAQRLRSEAYRQQIARGV